jgi:hypothetical protein
MPDCVHDSTRSPEEPEMMLVKRLLALEGDWITVPGKMEVEKIPKVCAMLNFYLHISRHSQG